MNATPDSADVCLIKMIHCYAAWFCQEGGVGGPGKDSTTSLWLVGPLVTRSCWKSWDVRRDSEERCSACSSMMLWGEQCLDGRFVDDTLANAQKYGSSAQEKPLQCRPTCTCRVPLNPSTCRHTSADLRTYCLSSFDCLNQFAGLPTAKHARQHSNDKYNIFKEKKVTALYYWHCVCRVSSEAVLPRG